MKKNYLLEPLRGQRTLMGFTVLMCWCITVAGNLVGANTDWFLSALLPLFDCYLACVLAWLLQKVRMGWLVTVAAVALLGGELFTVMYHHSNYSVHVMQLIMETNGQESSELLQTALKLPLTWGGIALTAALGGLAYLLGRWSRKTFRYKRVAVWVVMLLIGWSGIRQVSAYSKLVHCFRCQDASECANPQYVPHLNTPGVRFLYGLAFNRAFYRELDVLEQSVAQTTVDSCSYRSPLIVLIIGESYSKHHSQLYGYPRPTTPRLKAWEDRGQLVVYQDAVSPYNFTSNAFRMMFSTWDDDDQDSWTAHTLFPAVFRKAGYEVHFVTNQFTLAQTDLWSMAGGTIFNRQGLSDLQFTTRNANTHQYDEELLGDIPETDSLVAHPTLLIVHLIGQHVQYCDRYPPEFAYFQAADTQASFGGRQGQETVAHYDNATRYNDYVVDSLLQRLKDQDAIVLYLSDHGEEVYDWRDQFERTNEEEVLPEVAHYQFEIPLMFWMSERYLQTHPEVAKAVRDGARKPFISSDLPQVLFYLGGIRTREYHEHHNILSPAYDMKRRRVLRGEVEYSDLYKPRNS